MGRGLEQVLGVPGASCHAIVACGSWKYAPPRNTLRRRGVNEVRAWLCSVLSAFPAVAGGQYQVFPSRECR